MSPAGLPVMSTRWTNITTGRRPGQTGERDDFGKLQGSAVSGILTIESPKMLCCRGSAWSAAAPPWNLLLDEAATRRNALSPH